MSVGKSFDVLSFSFGFTQDPKNRDTEPAEQMKIGACFFACLPDWFGVKLYQRLDPERTE
jgi:hypothetical protein